MLNLHTREVEMAELFKTSPNKHGLFFSVWTEILEINHTRPEKNIPIIEKSKFLSD